MMYAILIYNQKRRLHDFHYNLDNFSFVRRFKIKSCVEACSETLIKKCELNTCYKIMEKIDDIQMVIYSSTFVDYHIIVTDLAYPSHTALKLLNVLAHDNTDLDKVFNMYVNPIKADKIVHIKNELDETKIISVNSIATIAEPKPTNIHIEPKTKTCVIF